MLLANLFQKFQPASFTLPNAFKMKLSLDTNDLATSETLRAKITLKISKREKVLRINGADKLREPKVRAYDNPFLSSNTINMFLVIIQYFLLPCTFSNSKKLEGTSLEIIVARSYECENSSWGSACIRFARNDATEPFQLFQPSP